MKKTGNLIALSLLAGLSINFVGLMPRAHASQTINLGIDTNTFPARSAVFKIKQDEYNKRLALSTLREIRAKMWDENIPYTLDESNPDNTRIRDYLSSVGINSKEAYVNQTKWSVDLEKIALQRAFEVKSTGLSHVRPDGSSYTTAVLDNGTKTYAEILASNSGGLDAAKALKQWAYSPRKNFNGKSEYDLIKESNGVYNSGNGHLHIALDPAYPYFGLAVINTVAVGEFGIDARSGEDASGFVGEYEFNQGKKIEIKNEENKNIVKKDNSKLKERLEESIENNKKTIAGAKFLQSNAPNTIKSVRKKLDKLMNESEKLIQRAEEMLKKL